MDGMDLLFGTPSPITFLKKKFDFRISPRRFMKWLKAEGEEVTGNYIADCGSMCEYACLYVSMLLHEKKLKGKLVIYYGKFGFWEHYWLGYTIDGEEYFIDLTLKQFISNAPKLAVTKAVNERVAGSYSYLSEGTPIAEYIEEKEAFRFYINPHTMKPASEVIPEYDLSSGVISLTKALESFAV